MAWPQDTHHGSNYVSILVFEALDAAKITPKNVIRTFGWYTGQFLGEREDWMGMIERLEAQGYKVLTAKFDVCELIGTHTFEFVEINNWEKK